MKNEKIEKLLSLLENKEMAKDFAFDENITYAHVFNFLANKYNAGKIEIKEYSQLIEKISSLYC